MSRKLEEKQARREAEERRRAENKKAARRRNLVTLGVALLVGALAVYLVLDARNETTQVAQGVAAEEAGCTDLEQPELMEGAEHLPDGTPVQYSTTPPTSGNHWANPSNAGFFSEPVAPETLVHNLEHGQIVIWYSPDAPDAVIEAIETYVGNERIALLAAPSDQVPSGMNFSFSAWGALQACENFSAEVLDEFRERFQGRGPENVGVPQFNAE